MTSQHRAAFFDFDGTLIRSDSQAMEATWRLRHQRHPALFLTRLLPAMATALLAAWGLVSQRTNNLAYLRTYRSCKAVDLKKQGEELFRNKIRRAFIPQCLEIMAAHRQAGDTIVIVSAAPHHILAPVGDYLTPDVLIGTHLETNPSGRCTGRPRGPICIGVEKAKQVQDLAARRHLDLAAAHAYSDHHADVPLLTSVGQPHVVNPTKRLEKMARIYNWPIHHY